MLHLNLSIDELKEEHSGIPELTQILNKINKKDTFILFNVFLQNYPLVDFPSDRELYVLLYTHELFVEDDFLKIYNDNPNSQFLILGDFYFNDLRNLNRVKCIRLCTWNIITKNIEVSPIDWENKTYRISSLSNYITQYRYFITCLLQNKTDCLLSWHNKKRTVGSDEHINVKTGHPLKDSLVNTLNVNNNNKTFFNNYTLDADIIKDSKNMPAYKNSLINCINETTDLSIGRVINLLPTPYITEKTWKPLCYGNALIFSGHPGTKQRLEEAGFIFNYPWDNSYDDIIGDLDRLERLLEILQHICAMDFNFILNSIKESCEYNTNHIKSQSLVQHINSINEKGLEMLENVL